MSVPRLYRLYVRLAGQPLAVGLAVFVAVASFVILGQLDAMLGEMHTPAASSYGMNDLVRVLPQPEHSPSDVVETWRAWKDEGGTAEVGPTAAAEWFLVVDTFFFAPAYTALLAFAAVGLARRPNMLSEHVTMLRKSLYAVPVLVLVDWVENLAQWRLVYDPTSGFHRAGQVFWGAKWLLVILILIPIVAAALSAPSRLMLGTWWKQAVVCRFQIAVVVFVALLLVGPGVLSEQQSDVIRRWSDDVLGPTFPVALTALLSVALVLSARWLLAAGPAVRRETPPATNTATSGRRGVLAITAAASAAALVLILWSDLTGKLPGARGLYVPPAVALLIAVLSLPLVTLTPISQTAVPENTLVAPALGAAPLFLLGVATLSAGAADFFYRGGRGGGGLLGLGLGLVLAALLFFVVARKLIEEFGSTQKKNSNRGQAARSPNWSQFVRVVGPGLVIAAAVAFGAAVDPWQLSRIVGGAIGVVIVFALVALLLGFLLAVGAERIPPPPAFTFFSLARIPMLTLLALWFVIASQVDTVGLHEIRTVEGTQPPSTETLGDAFDRWAATEATGSGQQPGGETEGRRVVPLVFVSAAGGGIRAAYWTALSMSCLTDAATKPCDDVNDNPVPAEALFAASGVSGGSLGLVAYAAHRAQGRPPAGESWVAERLKDDYLAPTVARTLFVDLPNSFLRIRGWEDRAAVLERSWERSWDAVEDSDSPAGDDVPPDGNPLELGFFTRRNEWPILLLNATSVRDGCRVVTSTVATSSLIREDTTESELRDGCRSLAEYERRADPPTTVGDGQNGNDRPVLAATKDAASYFCSDVRLSTSTLLSARFPIVSPSGRIGCAEGVTDALVDGGYFDNTGLSTIVELWQALAPHVAEHNRLHDDHCVVPFLVVIDNHYLEPTSPAQASRQRELLVPTHTLAVARAARESNASQAAALIFSDAEFAPGQTIAFEDATQDRIAYIYPRSHPGTEAPLGWTLSAGSRGDLEDQIAGELNQHELDEARTWFDGGASCTVAES
jgi:hypothetical protein